MMKINIKMLAVGVVALPFLTKAQEQKDTLNTNDINEVVVTGTLTERYMATLPVPTQLITGESIRKSGLSRLSEVIQEQTGLITVPDYGGGEGIQIQGMDAAYVMILVDGEPLIGRTAGTLDLSRISVNNIDRIEVVKGASSSLYGSEALAGVVNIITKDPEHNGKPSFSSGFKLGSFNTHDASVNFEYGKNKIAFGIYGNYYDSDGYNLSENKFTQTVEPFRNFTITPKVKIRFSDKLNLTAKTRFYNSAQDYKAQVSDENYQGKSKVNEVNYSLLLNHQPSERLKFTYNLFATHFKANEFLNDVQESLFEESDYNQWFFRPEVRSHYKVGKKNEITAGVGVNSENLDRSMFESKAKLNSEYVFGQFEWFIKDKWNVLAGFRYDHHNQYKSQISPKLAVNYRWTDNYSMKASIGYGYKAPDLRQLYLDFTNSTIGYTVLGYNIAEAKLQELKNQGQILNSYNFDFSEPLKPESSFNINLGGYYKKGKWFLNYNFFYNDITNLIDNKVIAQKTNGQNVFSYFNIHKIFTYGAELSASYRVNSHLNFSAGYQYLVAKDKSVIASLRDGEVFARDPETQNSFKLKPSDYFGLLNRSRHTANFKVNYTWPSIGTSVSARVFYRSKYGQLDSNNNDIIDDFDRFVNGYFLTNLAITKDFQHGISFQVGANNLFNYTDKANISTLPGIQVFGKVMYQF